MGREIGERLGEIDVHDLVVHPARLDARQVQDVVDEPEQVPLAPIDSLQRLALFGIDLPYMPMSIAGVSGDRIERGTQLVAHRGEEFGFRLVGRIGRLTRVRSSATVSCSVSVCA